MRVHLMAVSAASLLALTSLAQTPTFHADARTVAVYASVRDSSGRLATDLTKDAFELLEDGRHVDITAFSADPQPLSVAVMIDTSQSMTPIGMRDANLEEGVLAFVSALGPADRASIGTFGLEIAVGANLTNDRAELARVLREEVWSGGPTPLWQALVAAMDSLAREPGRRAVLVFTDGQDSGGLPGFRGDRSSVDTRAAGDDCMIYAVRFASRTHLSADIREVAERSGGGHYEIPADSDARATFAQIAEELRHQYLLGFVPAALDGRSHAIGVRLARPGLTARARKTYVGRTTP